MRKFLSILLCGIFLILFNESKAARVELFTLGYSGDYVRFDAHTGDIKAVLLDQPARPGGIAESLDGEFYTITYGNHNGPRGLYKVDPITGAHEYVCRTSNVYEIFGLAFSSEGTLYALDNVASDHYLGTLDIQTGEFVRIGRISGDTRELYDLEFRPNTEILYGSEGDGIFSIDLDTRITDLVVDSKTLNFEHILGFTFLTEDLVYVSGFYETSQYPNYDYGIALYNMANGEILDEVPMPYFTHQEIPLGHIAVVPEPATVLLLGLGVSVLRRKKRA